MSHGADVNAPFKLTPLHWAIEHDNANVFYYLMDKVRVNFNALDEAGRSPLCLATILNRIQFVERLLEEKDIHRKSSNAAQTPLFHAIQRGLAECVTLLIIDDEDMQLAKEMINLFWLAKNYGGFSLIPKLYSGDSINSELNLTVKDEGYFTPYLCYANLSALQIAIVEQNLPMIKFLASHPLVNIHYVAKGKTALDFAVEFVEKSINNLELGEQQVIIGLLTLIIQRLDPKTKAKINKQYKLIEKAILYNSIALLDCFSDVPTLINQGILYTVVTYGKHEMVKHLVDNYKLDINLFNPSILHVAIKHQYLKTVEVLLSYPHININTTYQSKTVLEHALEKGNIEILQALAIFNRWTFKEIRNYLMTTKPQYFELYIAVCQKLFPNEFKTLISDSHFLEKNGEAFIRVLDKIDNINDVDSLIFIASYFNQGFLVKPSHEKALEYYRKAIALPSIATNKSFHYWINRQILSLMSKADLQANSIFNDPWIRGNPNFKTNIYTAIINVLNFYLSGEAPIDDSENADERKCLVDICSKLKTRLVTGYLNLDQLLAKIDQLPNTSYEKFCQLKSFLKYKILLIKHSCTFISICDHLIEDSFEMFNELSHTELLIIGHLLDYHYYLGLLFKKRGMSQDAYDKLFCIKENDPLYPKVVGIMAELYLETISKDKADIIHRLNQTLDSVIRGKMTHVTISILKECYQQLNAYDIFQVKSVHYAKGFLIERFNQYLMKPHRDDTAIMSFKENFVLLGLEDEYDRILSEYELTPKLGPSRGPH